MRDKGRSQTWLYSSMERSSYPISFFTLCISSFSIFAPCQYMHQSPEHATQYTHILLSPHPPPHSLHHHTHIQIHIHPSHGHTNLFKLFLAEVFIRMVLEVVHATKPFSLQLLSLLLAQLLFNGGVDTIQYDKIQRLL